MNLEKLNRSGRCGHWPARQKGALTMFSAILILILLTEMIIYAVQVGVFEQRKSANEMRQKEAFHIADSALQFGKEYMLANNKLISRVDADVLNDGSDGWLSAAGSHWRECSDADLDDPQGEHPCYAEAADEDYEAKDLPADLRNNMYFWMSDTTEDPDDLAFARLPVDITGVLAEAGQQVEMFALLCMLDIDSANALLDPPLPVVTGCTTTAPADPLNANAGEQDYRYFIVTLLSRGQADCDGGNCTATALVADKIGAFGPGGGEGGPAAPLTTKSVLPESGSTDIVPNPNGGGEGVPISVWIDESETVDGLAGNAWATCERHEWYEVDIMPEDYRCPAGGGNCTCHGKKQLSHGEPGKGQHLDIDVVPDPDFPPDLYKYLFGVTGDAAGINYGRGLADEIVPDCDGLDEDSYGLIWVEGDCHIGGSALIGTNKAPVFLVLAGSDNRLNGGVEIFGAVFVTDVVNPDASLSGNGNLTIYGAIVADSDISKFSGNLKLVWHEDVLELVLDAGEFGDVAGGWSDFHQDWR